MLLSGRGVGVNKRSYGQLLHTRPSIAEWEALASSPATEGGLSGVKTNYEEEVKEIQADFGPLPPYDAEVHYQARRDLRQTAWRLKRGLSEKVHLRGACLRRFF